MIVEVQNLVKRYPTFELKNVSFGLERGRIAGFVGRNGAGKTTTIKSMEISVTSLSSNKVLRKEDSK